MFVLTGAIQSMINRLNIDYRLANRENEKKMKNNIVFVTAFGPIVMIIVRRDAVQTFIIISISYYKDIALNRTRFEIGVPQ